jgi:hypothetical protein
MSQEKQEVVVTDISMPFWSMVVFMVKWVIASIPAMLILSGLMAIFMTIMGSIGTGLGPR